MIANKAHVDLYATVSAQGNAIKYFFGVVREMLYI